MNELELERIIDIQKLGYEFLDKPVIVGGLAMEYYGLRKHGDDIDFIVTARDYQRLIIKFPTNLKNDWSDAGILVDGFELFRGIYKFDHIYYSLNAIELINYKIISLDMLFRMKVFAIGNVKKHEDDVQLLISRYPQFLNPEYQSILDRKIHRRDLSKNGIFVATDYDDNKF